MPLLGQGCYDQFRADDKRENVYKKSGCEYNTEAFLGNIPERANVKRLPAWLMPLAAKSTCSQEVNWNSKTKGMWKKTALFQNVTRSTKPLAYLDCDLMRQIMCQERVICRVLGQLPVHVVDPPFQSKSPQRNTNAIFHCRPYTIICPRKCQNVQSRRGYEYVGKASVFLLHASILNNQSRC